MSKRTSIANCNLHGGQPEVNFSDAFSDVIVNFDRKEALQADLTLETTLEDVYSLFPGGKSASYREDEQRGEQVSESNKNEPTVFEDELQLRSDEGTPKSSRKRHHYNASANKQFTPTGNPKAPALELVLSWVDQARNELSKELIMKSFEANALTIASNGSGVGKIACFKPEGSIGTKGINIFRDTRAQQKARDYKEAGIEQEEYEIRFENVSKDEILLFDD